MIDEVMFTSGCHIQALCKLYTIFQPHLKNMVQEYGHVISIALILLQFSMGKPLITHQKVTQLCTMSTLYVQTMLQMQTGTFRTTTGKTKFIGLQNHDENLHQNFSMFNCADHTTTSKHSSGWPLLFWTVRPHKSYCLCCFGVSTGGGWPAPPNSGGGGPPPTQPLRRVCDPGRPPGPGRLHSHQTK